MVAAWSLTMLRVPHVLAAAAVALASLSTPPAEACSPPLPGLYDTVPADGVTYPSNGHVLFYGYGIDLSGVSVTVDGVAASLVGPDPGDPLGRVADLVARVDPEPNPGQQVVITGTFCDDSTGEGGCEATSLTFIAGDPDTIAPSTGGLFELSYDAHDHTDTDGGVGSCFGGGGLRYYVHVDTDIGELIPSGELAAGATPMFWIVTGTSESAAEPAFERVVATADPDLDLVVTLDDMAVVDAADICIDVALVDAAGNALSEVASSCAACMYRNDDDGTTQEIEPDEPEWNSGDVYPGGLCTTGHPPSNEPPADMEDDSVAVSGCGCVLVGARDERAPRSGWLFALAGAALIVLRRDASGRVCRRWLSVR
jgi:hypothetical protein